MKGWGRVRVEKQVVDGNDPHEGHRYMCEGDMACVGVRRVSHGVVEIKLLCLRWLSPFLKHYHSPHPDTRHISFIHVPVAYRWVVALYSLFLYAHPPPLYQPPSKRLRLFSSQTFSHKNTPTFSTPVILHTYLSTKMEQTVFRNVGI